MITLYDFVRISENDFDTYDTEYDECVTVCHIYKEEDEYDKFCNGIIKKVNVIKINGDILVVNWCELISRNMDKFKQFTKDNWNDNCQYEDDIDEFIYQWIKEINLYMAGYVSDRFYPVLNKLVDSLE